ncbi:MAG: hypothetical protein V8T86_03290 [Victivallis sp.]
MFRTSSPTGSARILNGIVRRFDAGSIIIDFQRAEGIMPAKEKVHGEQYQPGERINAYLQKVDINTAGPSLIVSRACPEFVLKLFEREVSEIHDGVVVIKGIAREAGNRTKVAVMSTDPRVDPVGSCVGVRGNRVRNITAELGMERIDIVPWDADISEHATTCCCPPRCNRSKSTKRSMSWSSGSPRSSLKLAFGKKAQNVRLCSKLIGWKITIQNEEPKDEKGSIRDQLRQAAAYTCGSPRHLGPNCGSADQQRIRYRGRREGGGALRDAPRAPRRRCGGNQTMRLIISMRKCCRNRRI